MIACPTCAATLPAAFPGATVTCVCGERVSLPSPPSAPRSLAPLSGGGPYRGGSAMPSEDVASFPCPYCGNHCPALARVCPHCDVRLENVRCGRCWSLQQPGAFNCGRCGIALELEPVLDATNAPCPRCRTPLEAPTGAQTDDGRVHECPRCGGIFVPRDVLVEVLTRAELEGPFHEPVKRQVMALDEVRYVSCPLCHTSMNRLNFGKVSGVIVDVCKAHGTWFDGGELTRVIAFASSGGLQKTRAREAAEKHDLERQRASANRRGATRPSTSSRRPARATREVLAEQWRDFLGSLFSW